jgi:hypothetical protein
VLTTSANAVVAKKGSVAYDTSKAAANHLVRELAIELSPLVRVNGVAPATVVQGSAMFPRDRVIGSLAKYNIPYTDDEATDSRWCEARAILRGPHADQGADHPGRPGRGLLPPREQRLSKTTGQVITVDGGLHEAFLRARARRRGGGGRSCVGGNLSRRRAEMSWLARLPTAVPSRAKLTTGMPQALAVAWQSRRFFEPPPTMSIAFEFLAGHPLEGRMASAWPRPSEAQIRRV